MADQLPPEDTPSEELTPESEQPKSCDRPIECTECKRPIAVKYTEIVGNTMTHQCMCNECPVLRHKLYGAPHIEHTPGLEGSVGVVACGNCGTTLDAIRVGTPLGCDICYEVFDDVLIPEMLAGNRIPSRVSASKRTVPVHIGRTSGEVQEMNPALRLLALNEALNEMLKSEDYEQAAWLRDQIRELTEQTDQKFPEKPNEK